MLSSKKSHVSSKYLASICRSNPSFLAKITIAANYQKRTPHIVDAILLTIEYFQLYAQLWLINLYFYAENSKTSVQLPSFLVYFARIMMPGGMLRGATEKGTVRGLFIFCLIFSLLRIWLLLHVASAAKKGEKLGSKVATIWNWFFNFSARVFSSFMVSFWVITMQHALRNILGFDSFTRYCLIIIPGIFLNFEILVSLFIERNLSYNLPTKRFMSRKESVVESLTLVNKLFNQTILIFYVSFPDYLLPLAWFCNLYSLFFCLLRDSHFIRNFPLYNLKALRYEGCLLVLMTCQSLAYFVQTLLRVTYDEHIDPNFGGITWIVLGVLGVWFVNKRMDATFFKIATSNCEKKWNSNLLIHKAFIMKDVFKNHKLPSHQNQNHSFKHLMSQALSIHAQVILEEKDKNKKTLKKSWHKFFVGYFEYLTETFPKNNLIKLILAWFYIKKMELYGPGIRILHSLINSKDRSTAFNASLLIYELEKGTLANYRGEKSKLDLGEYTKSISAIINLKNLMLNQAKLQVKLCSGVSQTHADLYGVFKSAQNISQARDKVEKKIKKLFAVVPEYYLEPYKLCAYYNLSLNFSLEGFNDYEKLYSRISHKYQRFLSSKELTQQTLYNKNTNLYLISGAKANMGVITYSSKGCSKFIENSIIGTHVGSLCPKSLRKFYTTTINSTIEEGNKFFLDRIHDSFYYNFPTLESSPNQFYMNIVPYFTEGLHYAFISLPTRLPFDHITFSENGEIEAFTVGISRILGLPQVVRKGRLLNIADINIALGRANEAFNIVKAEGFKGSLSLEEAREIYQTYTNEGVILSLKPLSDSENLYTYRCKLVEKVPGSNTLRRIMFEKADNKVTYIGDSGKNDTSDGSVPSEFEAGDGINIEVLSPRDQILTSTRAFIPTQQEQKSSKKKTDMRSISDILELENQTEEENSSSSDERKPRIQQQHQQQSISSRTSSSSSNARLSKTLNEAIGNPYYAISHRIVIGLIGVLFLSILISQIAMKLTMDQETGNLEMKKEVLRSAEGRNNILVNLNRRYRYFDGAIKGWYTLQDISPNAIPIILSYVAPNTTSLARENSKLMDLAKVLNIENHERLFEKSVRVYQTDLGASNPVFVRFTSFQVTDQIVQASLKAINLIKDDYLKAERELNFIFKNSVNDLLLVGEETADLFLDSINLQIKVLKTKIGQTWMIALGFVGAVGAICLFLIYREYCQEITNLSAFVKINKKGVSVVSTKVSHFAKLIEDEVHFEDIKDMNLLNNSGVLDNFGKLKVLKIKEEAQIPNSKKIKRKYQLLVVKEVLLLAILMILISLMISLVGSFIDSFSKTLNQIYFLDRMIYKFDLAASTSFDLLGGNGTSYVRNRLSPVEFDHGIKVVNHIQNSIAEQLKNHDGSYDPLIEKILFDNACEYLDPANANFCMKSQNGADNANFIQLISNLESALLSMRTKYQQSNKTSSSLASLILKGQTGIAGSLLTITNIYKVMVSRLDEKFSEQISNYEDRKLQMVIIICIVTALACLVKYFIILGELENNLYQFRKALRLFPARLILSNFMLKAFLIKTTNGSFTWFKSDL